MARIQWVNPLVFQRFPRQQGANLGMDKDKVAYKRIFPLAFINGDCQSHNKMCGRYLAYENVPRICYAFDVSPEFSDSPDHVCNFF